MKTKLFYNYIKPDPMASAGFLFKGRKVFCGETLCQTGGIIMMGLKSVLGKNHQESMHSEVNFLFSLNEIFISFGTF